MSVVTRILAPNPSAMTLTGTNTYLLDGGAGEAICIDPGPPLQRHVDAILASAHAARTRIVAIVLTHGHPDHAPAATMLAHATQAHIYAHEHSAVAHDRVLRDGAMLDCGNLELQAVDAPGHTFEHLVFYERSQAALFTGDVVLGHGYVVIAPPQGNMRAYQRTLARLAQEFPQAHAIYPGHGERIEDPAEKLADYRAHRQTRERELLDALESGPQTIPTLVRLIYANTPPILWPAAARQLLAYLEALESEGRVQSQSLHRALDADEHAMLNPAWAGIVGEQDAKVIEAELGADIRLDELRVYERAAHDPS